jgi:hypothetical protein
MNYSSERRGESQDYEHIASKSGYLFTEHLLDGGTCGTCGEGMRIVGGDQTAITANDSDTGRSIRRDEEVCSCRTKGYFLHIRC